MRIVGLMTFVCLLLLLAMVPACLQFAKACGLQPSGTMTMAVVALLIVGMCSRRM